VASSTGSRSTAPLRRILYRCYSDPVLADKGFSALSMRAVAAAAGVSLAQVQYYFRSKDQLIAAAFRYVGDQLLASLHTVHGDEPSWARLREAIWLWLPLDDEREQAGRVWLAFAATAATHPRLTNESAHLDTDLRAWFANELDTLKQAGHTHPDLDTTATAAQLLALIDGVTLQSLVMPTEQRRRLACNTIDRFLTSLDDSPQ